jgi:hypothetical protein
MEYTGRGETINDNGFAQAKYPLTPRNHYFEIQIVDPGENCYIAIGLTVKVSRIDFKNSFFDFIMLRRIIRSGDIRDG